MRVCAPGCGRARGGGGVGADRACVRERRGGGKEGGNHRAPPLWPARCLAMSQPAPAPTSSVWVSGSCPEGLCFWPGQPTYPPGLGAGQRPMSAWNSHSEAATGLGGRASRAQLPMAWEGAGMRVSCLADGSVSFFSSYGTGIKRQGEGGRKREEGVVG